jgi:NADP-dependent 3-hydroxy acid dehydrogenase YdfG
MSSKVFIVTGASRGLGLAVAQALLQASHKVFLVARTAKDLQALKDQHPSSIAFAAADLSDPTVCDNGRRDGVKYNTRNPGFN